MDGFDPEKATVFSAAIVINYTYHFQYEKEVTAEMRQIDKTQHWRPKDYCWFWAALITGRSQEQVFEVLPEQYQEGQQFHKLGVFFS